MCWRRHSWARVSANPQSRLATAPGRAPQMRRDRAVLIPQRKIAIAIRIFRSTRVSPSIDANQFAKTKPCLQEIDREFVYQEAMMRRSILILTVCGSAIMASASYAQMAGPRGQGMGTGPVATACKAEIADKCAGKQHGNRAVRTCLESNRSSLSEACKTALDTTGGGRSRNLNK